MITPLQQSYGDFEKRDDLQDMLQWFADGNANAQRILENALEHLCDNQILSRRSYIFFGSLEVAQIRGADLPIFFNIVCRKNYVFMRQILEHVGLTDIPTTVLHSAIQYKEPLDIDFSQYNTKESLGQFAKNIRKRFSEPDEPFVS